MFPLDLTWNKKNWYLRMIFHFMLFHNRSIFNSCYFKFNVSLWVNTFLSHEITYKLNIKSFLCLVHVISRNKKTSEKTNRSTHVWVICSTIFASKSDVKDMITAFALQEEILCYAELPERGRGSHGHRPLISNLDEKHTFSIFSIFLIKVFVSINIQRILQKKTTIDVLGLLKLQIIFRSQPWLMEN